MTRAPVQRTTTDPPPPRRDRLLAWVVLTGCLALASVGLLVEIAQPAVTFEAEAVALETALQTHRRQAQFEHEPWTWDRVTPSRDGVAQLEAPPGLAWLHAPVLEAFDGGATLADAVLGGRLVAACFALLTVAAAFWAGMAIGGVVTASMSALICLAMPVLTVHGRVATGEAVWVGFSMLAIASALWAIRPLRPAATLTRQGIGWCVCGLALGGATLVAGPGVFLAVFVPILAMLLLVPHRVGHVMGLIAAVLIAVLMVTPWAGYAHLLEPEAWPAWLAPLAPEPGLTLGEVMHVAGERLLLILALTGPWTLWLPSALMQPFSTSSEGSRNRLFIGWTWFAVVTILVALAPGEATVASVLPAVAAASVMMGQLFRHGADLSAAGRHARFWRWLRFPQWGLLLAVTLVVPGAGQFQQRLVDNGWLPGPVVAPMHGLYWGGMAAVGVGVLLISLGPIIRHYPARAVVCWSLWSAVMGVLVTIPLARGPLLDDPRMAGAGERLASIVRDRPVMYLTELPRPGAVLTFHADRVLAPVTGAQLRRVVEHSAWPAGMYLLAPPYAHPGEPWEEVGGLDAPGARLWYCPPRSAQEPA